MTKDFKAYGATETLEDGAIFLFTLKKSVKQTWWVRYKLPNHTGYVQKKSLKTSDLEVAKTEAKREYTALRYAQHHDLPLTHVTLRHAFNEFTRRPKQGKPQRYKRYIIAYDRFVERFFKPQTPIQHITENDVYAYFVWRVNYWTETATKRECDKTTRKVLVLSKETLLVERQLLNSLFRYAFQKGMIAKQPNLDGVLDEFINRSDKVKQHTSRGFIDPDDTLYLTQKIKSECVFLTEPVGAKLNKYDLLRRYLKHNSKKWDNTGFIKRSWNGKRLYAWVLTITNTGIRPQTLLKLTWGDVHLRKAIDANGNEIAYTYISIPREKRKRRYYHQSSTHCVSSDYYRTWKRLMDLKSYYASVGRPTGANDLIFPSWKTKKELGSGRAIREGFRNTLQRLGLYLDGEGRTVCSYSFRSFFITIQARTGTSIRAIADQCNTSISQIEETYYKARPESYLDELVSGRGTIPQTETMNRFISKHGNAFQ